MLSRIALDFPVPMPLPILDGRSFISHDGQAWEALSWLPGEEIGFAAVPTLHDVGSFLAQFHRVSIDRSPTAMNRPGGIPLSTLAAAIDWDGAIVTMGSRDGVVVLREMVERFTHDLMQVGYDRLWSCVVHGDPTTFNVLAEGNPPRPSGLIDFELADVEPPIADVAFCLWRSGRPSQEAKELDLRRIRELVTGYGSERRLTADDLAALPICLRGRGLQMLAKRTQLAIADSGPIAQLRWIDDNRRELEHAVAGAA